MNELSGTALKRIGTARRTRKFSFAAQIEADAAENVAMWRTMDGTEGQPLVGLTAPLLGAPAADRELGAVMGQSLAGIGAAPVLALTSAVNVMFDDPLGIRHPTTQTALTAAKELTAETGWLPSFEALSASLGTNYLIVSTYVGATSIQNLGPGTANFEYTISTIQNAFKAAAASGEILALRDVNWVQGEEDERIGTTEGDYYKYLIWFARELNRRVKAITGQKETVVMWLSPSASYTHYNRLTPLTVPAMRRAARVFPDLFRLCPPKYHLSYGADGLHPNANGFDLQGLSIACARKIERQTGKRWKPLDLKAFTVGGKSVMLEFAVPTVPLVLDTLLCSDPGQYGFAASDVNGVLTLASATVVNQTCVRLTFDRAIAAGAVLEYAWTGVSGANAGGTTGPRGCLRDSTVYATAFSDRSGNPFNMQIPAMPFSVKLN